MHVYDFLATLGFVICFAVGVLLIFAITAELCRRVRAFRRAFRELYKRARYPTSAQIDREESAL